MGGNRHESVLKGVHTLSDLGTVGGLSDGELLGLFTERGDQKAALERLGRASRADGFARLSFDLCDLEGLTCQAAARRLGWPVRTVKSRLARGRDRLLRRLIRRGFGPEEPSSSRPATGALTPPPRNSSIARMRTADAVFAPTRISASCISRLAPTITYWAGPASAPEDCGRRRRMTNRSCSFCFRGTTWSKHRVTQRFTVRWCEYAHMSPWRWRGQPGR